MFSTSFLVFQHWLVQGWDFSAYVLNARYLFSRGVYYEHYRPVLMPFIIGLFSIFSYKAAEFLYIILSSSLFGFAAWRLSGSVKLDKVFFYFLLLNPFTLFSGTVQGTELLSLAFIMLFLDILIRDEHHLLGGVFFGLAFLTRYTVLSYAPLVLIAVQPKKILKLAIGIFFAVIPWLLFNYVLTGDMLTSIADAYFLNIKSRAYFVQPVNIMHFLEVANILIPFVIFGIVAAFIKALRKSRSWFAENRVNIAFFALMLFIIYKYVTVPVKNSRYLFDLILPAAYFAAVGIIWLAKLIPNLKVRFSKQAAASVIVLYFAALFFIYPSLPTVLDNKGVMSSHQDAAEALERYNISGCALMTNSYVYMNYLGQGSESYPRQSKVNSSLEEGYHLLMFTLYHEPEYSSDLSFLRQFPVIYEDPRFIVLGDASMCLEPGKNDLSYVKQTNNTLTSLYGEGMDTSPCSVLFSGRVFKGLCDVLNP